jgi:hypothetical protein
VLIVSVSPEGVHVCKFLEFYNNNEPPQGVATTLTVSIADAPCGIFNVELYRDGGSFERKFIRVEGFNTLPFGAFNKGIKPRIQIPYKNNNLAVPLGTTSGRGC